jgi:putative ABC transport system permease protein
MDFALLWIKIHRIWVTRLRTLSISFRPCLKKLRPALMWNYVRFFFRKIKIQKEYAALNFVGLTLGMACFIFVFLWVKYEHSYDRFHDKQDRIFLVLADQGSKAATADSSLLLGPALKKRFKEIEEFCRIRFKNASLIGTRYHEQKFYLADSTFFQIFTFPFVRGNPKTALSELNAIVITEETAARYFGDKNPLGQTLHVRQFDEEFKVTGVVKDIPLNSHIRFDLVARIEWMGKALLESKEPACFTYLLLRPEVSQEELDQKIRTQTLGLHPLTGVHRDGWDEDRSSRQIYFYLALAVIIWALAGLNFIILSTARFIKNAREVGIRKVSGASRPQILIQHVLESILFSFLALLPALLIVQLTLPFFNSFFGKGLSLVSPTNRFLLLELAGMVLAAGILAGFHPTVILSSVRPHRVLKGSFSMNIEGFRLKKILITFQFSVAIGLILCSFIVFKQLRLIREKGLGFSQNSIVVVPNQIPYEEFKEELIKDTNIVNITAASSRPLQVRDEVIIRLIGEPQDVSFSSTFQMIDFDFFETFEMEIIEGRNFSKYDAWDWKRTCIVNESFAQKLGAVSPVGKKIYFDHPMLPEDLKEVEIMGVVKDYHPYSMHQTVSPFVFRFYPPAHYQVFIKIRPGTIKQTLPLIEQAFKKFNPPFPFYFEFLEDTFGNLYQTETLMGWLFNAFAFSAVLISCIGLFGLASYSAEHKTREIGIRKIFGASLPGLVFRMSREMTSCVLLANIIAWPVVYLMMKKWLENYVFQTNLGLGIFLVSGLFTLFLALLTAGSKIIKIAEANPSDALKYE